jgi:putative PEP-CTERM system histidine kinase
MVGETLVGLLWLSGKRNEEDYSSEDVEFLAAMARQVTATLWFARIAEQLAETRQLESLNRLSSFVLHDIKNHVSGLSLVVENARRHLSNPEFQRDAMAVVERTVRNLRELMNQVAGVARSPDVHIEPCDARDLLDEAALASGLVAGERDGIRLAIDCPPALQPVQADRRLMLRVLVNLLTNAREALSGSGSIELRAAVDTDRSGEARMLTLTVADTGRGMTEEFLRTQLFKPFSTTKPSGLGVGLAQCKSIVEAHSGSIAVESRAGKGTTFSVRIPIEGPSAAIGNRLPGSASLPLESSEVANLAREVGR